MLRISTWFPYFIIIATVFVLFSRLFFPRPQVIFTSESLGSDIRANYYPGKDFLGKSLRKGELPFWSRGVGAGFPMFAEGQIGALYPPNWLYAVLPTWLAWNLNYVLAFFLAFLGSYRLWRRFELSVAASLFSGFSFSFGGYYVSRMIHMSPLQAISLTPWVFLAADYWWQKPGGWRGLALAVLVALQLLTGGMQWVFLTLVGVVIFLVAQLREGSGVELGGKLARFGVLILVGFVFAGPQLLPTWELWRVSNRASGLESEEIFFFPYSWRDFLTLLVPDLYGTPKDGTYLVPRKIYWENTAYLGILPVVYCLLFLLRRGKKRWQVGMLVMGAVAWLLIPGRESPLSFILTLPGFNVFRVPSRFLLLLTLAIAGLAGSGLDWLSQSVLRRKAWLGKVLVGLTLVVSGVDLFAYSSAYHPLLPVEEAFQVPETARGIAPQERIFTYPEQIRLWKEAFLRGGWQDTQAFRYFQNGLYANLNLLFDRANIRAYAGLYPWRQRFHDFVPNLLDVAGVRFVISPVELGIEQGFELVARIDPPREDLPPYFVYRNQEILNRFRFVSEYVVGKDRRGVEELLGSDDFPFTHSVILEEDVEERFEGLGQAEIEVLRDEEQEISLRTATDQRAILVVADSYYTAWQARVDGVEAEIMPANLNQRAVVVPSGEHRIEFTYSKARFSQGVTISLVTLGLSLMFILLHPKRWFAKRNTRLDHDEGVQ